MLLDIINTSCLHDSTTVGKVPILLDVINTSCLHDSTTVGKVPILLRSTLLELFTTEALRRTHLEFHLTKCSGLYRALNTKNNLSTSHVPLIGGVWPVSRPPFSSYCHPPNSLAVITEIITNILLIWLQAYRSSSKMLTTLCANRRNVFFQSLKTARSNLCTHPVKPLHLPC